MSRENTYLAIILKKQPFGEADEIVTIFSREAGKLRLLAKSVKFSKSKLQHALQALFLTRLRASNGRLPKIIGAQTENSFIYLRQNLPAIKNVFYASELVIKFTPDEHKNERLFDLLLDFLQFLNHKHLEQELLDLGLAKFKTEILKVLGMGIAVLPGAGHAQKIGFDSQQGGFTGLSGGAAPVSAGAYSIFKILQETKLDDLKLTGNRQDVQELQDLLSDFVEYQLEREVRSEKYLRSR